MEDRESLARKQDELLSEHLSSVGGYSLTPPPSQPRMSQQQYDQRVYQQQQYQHVPQHLAQAPYQGTQQDALAQQLQQQRPLNGPYAGLQPRLSMRLPPGPALANGSIYQGYIPGRPTPGVPTSQPVGRSPVMRSNSMYSTHMTSVPRYPPQRQQLVDQSDHQKRQYQQYEQQQHYYREPSSMAGADLSAVRPPFGPVPYRQSTYQGVYNGSSQLRIATPRQQQIQQMQAPRPMTLGPLSPNRFSVARDMLPTAPSPSVFSATQPAPLFPEPSNEPSSAATSSTDVTLSSSTPGSDIVLSPVPQEVIPRNPNHNSIYSLYSPVVERARPRSTIIEPSGILSSPLTLHASMSATSLNNLSSTMYSTPSSKSRSSHAQSFSRQVTLSSIPAKEEVPPMPGKVTSKTGKVRIQLTFDRPYFNAGGELSGRLEIQCSSSRSVMLADMFIELLGYEALAKDHLTPKIFHKTILRLQDIRHASQAVQENVEPDVEGYWLARKGRTIFPFRLNIQDSLPNSYDSKLGQVRYVASAIACMKANQSKEVVNHTREVFIYETWTTDDITQARRKSVKADTSKRLFMGGDGSLEMYAEMTRTMVSSGGIVYVNVGVKNLTKKKIMGIKLSLWRHIAASQTRSSICSLSSSNGSREQDNVKNYSEIIYKGEDYAFDNDDPRLVVLPVYIPSGVYSLRNTNLLHVQFFIQVSLLASMSKALTVELPLYITHASSWSDPPPRIPRDFTFPVHEDEPVKKHKTGVFAKKRPSSIVNQASSSPRKQPSSITSSSAPTSKAGTPRLAAAESSLIDGNGSRPITRRSPLKDPDSPTSVLDFSQAGNLFVVNPDSSSITGSDAGSIFKQQPISAWSSPTVHDPETSESPAPSRPSSPLDRSAPLVLAEQEQFKDEEHGTQEVVNDEEDFDMSRSVNPQFCPSKKDQEKSKHGKMGLRKTLAKLSISIPTHGNGICSSHGKSSKISPRVLPTTPRSAKSQLNSSDDMSADSRSPGAGRSLSRQSSTSSLGSFTSRFDKLNRKSSVGSTRVMSVSPGPVSPESGQIRSLSSRAKSAPTSMPNSTTASANASANASGASSPLIQSGPSSSDSTEDRSFGDRKHDIVHLSMTAAAPDVLLHHGTPLQEDTGRVGYFQDGKDQSRSTTPNPSDHGAGQDQSAPSTPSSPRQPWQLQRNFSTSSVASSLLEPHETLQTAQGIRDEFYYGKGASMNASTDSFVTRVAPAQTGIPSQEHAIYTTNGNIYDEPLTANLIDPSAPLPTLPPQAQPLYTDTPATVLNTTEQPPIPQLEEQQHQDILHDSIPRQSSWTSNQYAQGCNCQGPHTPNNTVLMNRSSTPPTQMSSGKSSRVASRQPSPAQRTAVPTGLVLTPAQSPEGYYGDVHSMVYPSRENAPEWIETSPPIDAATSLNIDPNTLGLSGAAPIQYISQSNPPPLSQDPNYAGQGQSYVPVPQVRTPVQYQTPQMVAQSPGPGLQAQQVQAPSIQIPQISQIPQIQHVVKEDTQEVYTTPMIPSDESTMRPEQAFLIRTPEAATLPESVSMYAVPQAVMSLSSAYQPDPSRLSPNDVGIGAGGQPLAGSYNRSLPSSPGYPVDPTYQHVVSPQPSVTTEQLQHANHALQNTLYKDDVRAQPYQPQTHYSPNVGVTWNLESKSQVVSPQPLESGYYTGTEQQLYTQQVQPDQQTPDRQQQQQLEEQQRLEVLQRAQDQLILQEQVQLQEQARLHEQIRMQEQSILQEQQRLQEQRILNEQQRIQEQQQQKQQMLQEQFILQQQQQQQQLQLQQQQDEERRLQEQLRQQQQQQQLQQHQIELQLQQQLGLQYQQQKEYYQQPQHQQPPPPQQQLQQPEFQVSEVAMVHQSIVSTPQPSQQSWVYQSPPMSMSVNQPVITPQLHAPDPMGAIYIQQQQTPYAVNNLSQGYTLSPSQQSPSQLSPSQHSPQSHSHPSSRGHSQPQSRAHSRSQSPSVGLRVQPPQPDMGEEPPVTSNYVYEGKMELSESESMPSVPQDGLESALETKEHYTGVETLLASPLGYSGSLQHTPPTGLSVMNPDQ